MSKYRPIALVAALAMVTMRPACASANSPLPDLPVINQDLTLPAALLLAKEDNLSIRQSAADVDAASAAARSAAAQSRPGLATTTYALTGDSSNIVSSSPGVLPQNYLGIPSQGFLDQNLALMIPLYTGGKLRARAGSADAQKDAASLTSSSIQLSAQETVTAAYVQALLQKQRAAVAVSRLTAETEQVRVTGEQVQTGHSAPVDLLREQAEEANAQQGLLTAQTDEALSLIRLKTALGVSQNSTISLADTLDTVSEPAGLPASLPEAIQTAETDRPDLAAALKQVDAAREGIRAAEGAYSPQVYALGMADSSSSGDGGERAGYTVGLTASLPLYDGGERNADTDASRAHLRRATLDAETVRQTVDQDAASAWLNLAASLQQIPAAQAGVAAAQQAYDLATLRYNAGKSIAAERLDTLAALTRAQGDLSTAKAAVIEDRARLLAAIGHSQ